MSPTGRCQTPRAVRACWDPFFRERLGEWVVEWELEGQMDTDEKSIRIHGLESWVVQLPFLYSPLSMSRQEDEIVKAPEVTHQELVEQPAAPGGSAAPDAPKKRYRAQDDAIDILADVGGYVEYTIDEDKSVLRKIDIRVCSTSRARHSSLTPVPMFLIYSLVHLDKSALSYGAVFNLQKETHLEGAQYSWLTSIIYLVQLVVQPISAYALVRLPLAKWVIFNVFCCASDGSFSLPEGCLCSQQGECALCAWRPHTTSPG
jgi:hypothetical protein